MSSKATLGIALSGGGIRGIAHLGVLQALNDYGIFPTHLSGSSAGAIVGAMYAKGFAPKEIFDIIVQTNYFKFIRPAISWTGILKMDTTEELYRKYLGEDSFESLNVKLTVAATDIQRGKVIYFNQGELIKPVMASSCIPGMFDPIQIGNKILVDGGVLNNLPVEPLEGVCDTIIGVNCNHLPMDASITNIKKLVERTVIMSMNYNVYSRKSKCDYFIEPKGLAKYGVFDIKKAQEIYDAGYTAVINYMDEQPELKQFGMTRVKKA